MFQFVKTVHINYMGADSVNRTVIFKYIDDTNISLVAEKADFYNVTMTKENTAIKLAATSLAGKLVSRKMLYLRHNQNEGERNNG